MEVILDTIGKYITKGVSDKIQRKKRAKAL